MSYDAINVVSVMMDCGYSDSKYFIDLLNEHNLDLYDLKDYITDDLGFENPDINSYIYGALSTIENNFKEKVVEYIDENNFDLDEDKIQEFESNIYTNFLDSGFNSVLGEYDLANVNEDEIQEFLLEIYGPELIHEQLNKDDDMSEFEYDNMIDDVNKANEPLTNEHIENAFPDENTLYNMVTIEAARIVDDIVKDSPLYSKEDNNSLINESIDNIRTKVLSEIKDDNSIEIESIRELINEIALIEMSNVYNKHNEQKETSLYEVFKPLDDATKNIDEDRISLKECDVELMEKNEKLHSAKTTTDSEYINIHLESKDWQVRNYLAQNPNLSQEQQLKLANDDNFEVRFDLAQNHNTSSEALEVIYNKRFSEGENDYHTTVVLSNHKNTPKEILEELALSDNEDVADAAFEALAKRQTSNNALEEVYGQSNQDKDQDEHTSSNKRKNK